LVAGFIVEFTGNQPYRLQRFHRQTATILRWMIAHPSHAEDFFFHSSAAV
jgi:hypothetical protein